MKFIITENRLKELVFNKLENHPKLERAKQYPSKRRDGSIYGYEFLDKDDFTWMYMEYEIEPEEGFSESDSEKKRAKYPILKVANKILLDIMYSYGKNQIKYIKDWFEKKYNLPVSTMKEPYE